MTDDFSASSEAPSQPKEDIREIDYTGDSVRIRRILTKEHTRKWISFSLISILAAIILAAIAGFLTGKEPTAIKEFLIEVLGPMSALVGSVVGFYFGSKDD